MKRKSFKIIGISGILAVIALTIFNLGCKDKVKSYHLIGVKLPSDTSAVVKNISGAIKQQIELKCDAKVVTEETAPYTIELAIEKGIGNEGFKISTIKDDIVKITGNDQLGLLYGIGKFLHTSQFKDGFTPGIWRGTSVPKSPFRAFYLSLNFSNYFAVAPIEKVEQYFQDLGLWGYNTVAVVFPYWQYTSISDSGAQKIISRLKSIFIEVKKYGLNQAILEVPNEGWKNSPVEMRRDSVKGNLRGNLAPDAELCVSKPEACEYLLKVHEQIMDEYSSSCKIDYYVYWPYDEGACGCKKCAPWGANGFVNMSKKMSKMVKKHYPDCKFIISTWCFENENDSNPEGEWVGLNKALLEDKSWADYILADGHEDYFPKYLLETGVPGNLPLINFPEISMYGMFPWGGYGVNPLPKHFQQLWDRIKHKASGGMPYSEGIYDDLNKVIIAGLYWDPDRKAEETVREYSNYEFNPAISDDMVEVVNIFEKNHFRELSKKSFTDSITVSALRAFELVSKAEEKMTEQAKKSWRWRIFYLRALIDKEIYNHKGKLEGDTLKKAFEELTKIYYAENAFRWVKPPTIK